MRRVVVTGLGFATSIGCDKESVADSLWALRHGFSEFPSVGAEPRAPKFFGSVDSFEIEGWDPEDWSYPSRFTIARSLLKSMSPHVLYSYCSTLDAIDDAGLGRDQVSSPLTGIYSASAGSSGLQYEQLKTMKEKGVARCSPYGIVSTTVGTINFNLGSALKIQGSICGFASACASSAHSLGFAYDAIASGRQDRMIVVGAEDCTRETILPFAGMRALSSASTPEAASCPFDSNRSGFVGSGGAATLILETAESATARGAEVYAEIVGWAEAGDGHSPAMPHPEGRGMMSAMKRALELSSVDPAEVDYVNAHATSTLAGDLAEMRALKAVFGGEGQGPFVSSTKALTGHPLSMAGALEAAICCLSLRGGYVPGSAHIEHMDPEAAGLNIVQETRKEALGCVLSNSSGFGGSNVSLVFKKWGA